LPFLTDAAHAFSDQDYVVQYVLSKLVLIWVMAFNVHFLDDSDPDYVVQFVLSKLALIKVMSFSMPFLADSDPDSDVQFSLPFLN
jgi:hypothetical protein